MVRRKSPLDDDQESQLGSEQDYLQRPKPDDNGESAAALCIPGTRMPLPPSRFIDHGGFMDYDIKTKIQRAVEKDGEGAWITNAILTSGSPPTTPVSSFFYTFLATESQWPVVNMFEHIVTAAVFLHGSFQPTQSLGISVNVLAELNSFITDLAYYLGEWIQRFVVIRKGGNSPAMAPARNQFLLAKTQELFVALSSIQVAMTELSLGGDSEPLDRQIAIGRGILDTLRAGKA